MGSYEDQAGNKLKRHCWPNNTKYFLRALRLTKNISSSLYRSKNCRNAIADKNDIDKLLTTDSIVLKYVP